MTLTEILCKRRSVRKFVDRAVEQEKLGKIVAAALTAPSSKNTRSTRFMVVRDRETLVRMASMRDFGSSFLKDVPAAVVVLGDTEATDLWVDNCAISATILQLAAEEQGLASCWVHVNGRPRLREQPEAGQAMEWLRTFLPIPETWKALCVVAVGYPEGEVKPHGPKDDSDKVMWL